MKCILVRRTALIGAAAACLLTVSQGRAAEVLTPEEEAAKRIGFYFALSLERASQLGNANGIGLRVDEPDVRGDFDLVGPEVDGDLGARNDVGFLLGFRLRNQKGRVEASFYQFDQLEDVRTEAGEGKAIANTLASPRAGVLEDIGGRFSSAPDGLVAGYEAGILSEISENEPADPGNQPGVPPILDGAEDINFNGTADFIRFDTSDLLIGKIETDFQTFDLDYIKRIGKYRKFELDGRAGLRIASLSQLTDIGYRDVDSFAVYSDDERDVLVSSPCFDFQRNESVYDGDGDGFDGPGQLEPDGDGFMDGNCNGIVNDELTSVETVTEDRILALIDTQGAGLKLGLDGRYQLTKKWSLSGGVALSLLSTDVEYRYRETFTSERDRYLNFIEWDFNGDGEYNNLDLDFSGNCERPENCDPDPTDSTSLERGSSGARGLDVRTRTGVRSTGPGTPGSVTNRPDGTNPNAFSDGVGGGLNGEGERRLRVGDPVPESERNTDILRETTLLADLSGDDSGLTKMLDVRLAAEYRFSDFARIDFGLKASRWFDAGSFRSLASDVVAGREPEAGGGDFKVDGYFVRLTVVPR